MEKNNQHPYISNSLKLALSRQFNVHISDITKDFMKGLTEIDLSGNNIKDIKGIEFAINAVYINLNKNNICDASPLSKLNKLEELELNENKIEDISFIKNLKKLKRLGLDSNNIKAIPNINNTELQTVNLDNNRISNLSEFNKPNFRNTTILATDQCIILDPIEIDMEKSLFFSSNIIWDVNSIVFLDNIQVNGKYDSIHTNERPSMLYSISEIVINNIKSNCILKADFYKEDTTSFPRILSGTLIQPIYLKSKEAQVNSSNSDFSLSNIFGYIKPEEKLADLKQNESYSFRDKVVTLINEYGDIVYSSIDINGKYLFNNIQAGKYTILFPVLSDYVYTSPSVVVLNIEEKGSFIINSSIEYIDH